MKKSTNIAAARKPAVRALVLALSCVGLASLPLTEAVANPQGGQVAAGSATIRQETSNKVGITQGTDKAIIDWRSFSIGANEKVQFYQPSASSVTLNRVVGQDPSQILGSLTANGQVFLVNPNGIYFGKNAQIDVAGLVASTHNIRNEDFLAGKYNFNLPGKPGAAVINEGTINIADTGIAAFVAPSVANRGVIVAKLGKVALASANGFTLDFTGDQLLTFLVGDEVAKTAFDIDGKQLTSFVDNSGRIEAQGGYVLLIAKAAENAIHSVINQSGVIEATTVGTSKGEIILWGGNHGVVEVSGTLNASAPNGGDGGFIETSGQQLAIDDSAVITTIAPQGKAGTWLIDPRNIVIANGGANGFGSDTVLGFGDNSGSVSTLDPSLLNNALSNVELQATNDITFTNAVSMTHAGVGITAKAGRNIRVNAPISTNNGDVQLLSGWSQSTNSAAAGTGAVDINSSTISSGTGRIVIAGRGSASLVDPWKLGRNGVLIRGGSVVQSSSGSITIIGYGVGDWGFGVDLEEGARVTSTDGYVYVAGYGGSCSPTCINVAGAGVAVGHKTISSSEISVTGRGGLEVYGMGGNSAWSYGVIVGSGDNGQSSTLQHSGTSALNGMNITGVGANASASSAGVVLFGAGAVISTNNAPMTIIGASGFADLDSSGILAFQFGQNVVNFRSTGTGSITLVGASGGAAVGGQQYGISLGGGQVRQPAGGYIQTTGSRVNLFSDSGYIRSESIYGAFARGASYVNIQPYSAYATYAGLTAGQKALVEEYQSASATTLVAGINARKFRNDPADPVWRQLYVNGVATSEQVSANNQLNAMQAAENARLAQVAADQAAAQAAADAWAAAQALDAARAAQAAADKAAADKAADDARRAAEKAAADALKAQQDANAAAEAKIAADRAKALADAKAAADLKAFQDAQNAAAAARTAAERNAANEKIRLAGIALNTSNAAVISVNNSLAWAASMVNEARVQASNANISAENAKNLANEAGRIAANTAANSNIPAALSDAIQTHTVSVYLESKIPEELWSLGAGTALTLYVDLISDQKFISFIGNSKLFGNVGAMTVSKQFQTAIVRAIDSMANDQGRIANAVRSGGGLIKGGAIGVFADYIATVMTDELKKNTQLDSSTYAGAFGDYGIDIASAAFKDAVVSGATSPAGFLLVFQMGFTADMAVMSGKKVINAWKLSDQLVDATADMNASFVQAAQGAQGLSDRGGDFLKGSQNDGLTANEKIILTEKAQHAIEKGIEIKTSLASELAERANTTLEDARLAVTVVNMMKKEIDSGKKDFNYFDEKTKNMFMFLAKKDIGSMTDSSVHTKLALSSMLKTFMTPDQIPNELYWGI